MINEAVKILRGKNKAQRPSDIDVVWLNGYGWARRQRWPDVMATWSARRP